MTKDQSISVSDIEQKKVWHKKKMREQICWFRKYLMENL